MDKFYRYSFTLGSKKFCMCLILNAPGLIPSLVCNLSENLPVISSLELYAPDLLKLVASHFSSIHQENMQV